MAEPEHTLSLHRHFERLYRHCRSRYPLPLQFAQFCAVGASGVLVDLGMVHLVYHGAIQSMPAARFAGIAVAMIWNFYLNRHLTFRHARRAPILPQFARFTAACSLGAALNWLVSIGLFLYVPWFAGRVARCALVGVVAATGSNFVLAKYFAFRHHKHVVEPTPLEDVATPLRSPST